MHATCRGHTKHAGCFVSLLITSHSYSRVCRTDSSIVRDLNESGQDQQTHLPTTQSASGISGCRRAFIYETSLLKRSACVSRWNQEQESAMGDFLGRCEAIGSASLQAGPASLSRLSRDINAGLSAVALSAPKSDAPARITCSQGSAFSQLFAHHRRSMCDRRPRDSDWRSAIDLPSERPLSAL